MNDVLLFKCPNPRPRG